MKKNQVHQHPKSPLEPTNDNEDDVNGCTRLMVVIVVQIYNDGGIEL